MEISVDNIKINYTDNKDTFDTKGGILILHGWGTDINVYKSIIDYLSPYMRTVALDMAGFGKTDEPPIPWCVDDYVTEVEHFCKAIDFAPECILGHSFGGRVIIKSVTKDNPVLTPEKLILTDSAGIMPKRTAADKLKTATYKAGRNFMSTAPMKALFPNAVENMRKKRGSADYLAASPIMRQTLVKVVNEDLSHLLSKIKQSTLLIWGENDDATPISDGKTMEQLIPDSGLVTIENAGHYAFLDNPYLFRSVLKSFLNIK